MNIYNRFKNLLPVKPKVLGVITAVNGELHTIKLLGGGIVQATSQKPYTVNTSVFVEGDNIVSSAPNNENIQLSV